MTPKCQLRHSLAITKIIIVTTHTGNEWMIEEADEYDRSLTIVSEHCHHWIFRCRSFRYIWKFENMVESYVEFASQIQEGGLLLMSDHIQVSDLNYLNPNLIHLFNYLRMDLNWARFLVSFQIMITVG